MPQTITGSNVFASSIPNFPISGNNEPLTIEPITAAVQAVLNNTVANKTRLDTLETSGVKKLRTFNTRAALSGASGYLDGDQALVEGYGLYQRYNPSGLASDGLWVLNATGGGIWMNVLNSVKASAGGLATLDGSSRLAQDVRDASVNTQHLVDSSVTAVKLGASAITDKLGYTPFNKAGDTMTGGLSIFNAGGNSSIEIGKLAIAENPFIDFHSGGFSTDYDARIIASGGSAAVGSGTLNLIAGSVQVNGNTIWNTLNFNPALKADLSGANFSGVVSMNAKGSASAVVNAPGFADAAFQVYGDITAGSNPNRTPRLTFHMFNVVAPQIGIFPGTTAEEISSISGSGLAYIPFRASAYRIGATTVIDTAFGGLFRQLSGNVLNLSASINGGPGGNTSIELGSLSGVETPFLDFHSSGTGSDFDARLLASGGNATPGNGTLTAFAATFNFSGANFQQNGNQIWHAGNFNPSSYLTTAAASSTYMAIAAGSTGGARARMSSQSIPNGIGTGSVLTLNTEDYDDNNFYAPTNNYIEIPAGQAGLYLISANCEWFGNNTSGSKYLNITVNNLSLSAAGGNSSTRDVLTGDVSNLKATLITRLAVGDRIRLYAEQNTGAASNVFSASLSIAKVRS